jgi:hypothetical protein
MDFLVLPLTAATVAAIEKAVVLKVSTQSRKFRFLAK